VSLIMALGIYSAKKLPEETPDPEILIL